MKYINKNLIIVGTLLGSLLAAPAVLSSPTVFNNSGSFNSATSWNDGLPGENGNFNSVIQGVVTATTTDDHTNADGDPINFSWNLTPRASATVNIGHSIDTGSTGGNTGNIFHGTSNGSSTINHSAGTLTTGNVFIGHPDTGNTDVATYDISGTAVLDAGSIDIRDTGRLRVFDTASSVTANSLTLNDAAQLSFTPGTTDVGSVNISGAVTLSANSSLVVNFFDFDMESFIGTDMVLLEYDSLSGTFGSIDMVYGRALNLDYNYDLGGGNFAIALVSLQPTAPEPSTLGMLVVGAGVLAARRRNVNIPVA